MTAERVSDEGFYYSPANTDGRAEVEGQVRALVNQLGDASEVEFVMQAAKAIDDSGPDGGRQVSTALFVNRDTGKFISFYILEGRM